MSASGRTVEDSWQGRRSIPVTTGSTITSAKYRQQSKREEHTRHECICQMTIHESGSRKSHPALNIDSSNMACKAFPYRKKTFCPPIFKQVKFFRPSPVPKAAEGPEMTNT